MHKRFFISRSLNQSCTVLKKITTKCESHNAVQTLPKEFLLGVHFQYLIVLLGITINKKLQNNIQIMRIVIKIAITNNIHFGLIKCNCHVVLQYIVRVYVTAVQIWSVFIYLFFMNFTLSPTSFKYLKQYLLSKRTIQYYIKKYIAFYLRYSLCNLK